MTELMDGETIIAEATISSKLSKQRIMIGIFIFIFGIFAMIGSFSVKGRNSMNKLDAGTILIFLSVGICMVGFLMTVFAVMNKNKTHFTVTNMRITGTTVADPRKTDVIYIDENIDKITNVTIEKTQADNECGCATVVINVSSKVYRIPGIQNYQEIVNAIKKQMK